MAEVKVETEDRKKSDNKAQETLDILRSTGQKPTDYVTKKYGVPAVPVPQPDLPTMAELFPDSPLLAVNQPGYGVPSPEEQAFRRAQAQIGQTEYVPTPVEEPVMEPTTDWLAEALAMQAQYAPDYSGIAAALQDEGLAINAQIQALYNQLAEGAEQNVAQLEDIYGGARAGVGEAYDIGTGATEQAYQSAQQQAADQLARLGIEEAAPRVIDPMALSQAEAQSALESGRSAGLAGVARSGATAQDFASQMAQVGQMQGAEYQRSVADQLRRQLLGLELQAQQGAYQRALQAPGLAQDLYAASQLGQPQGLSFEQQLELDRFAYQQAQDAAEIQMQLDQRDSERYTQLFDQLGDAQKALEQLEYERAQGLI